MKSTANRTRPNVMNAGMDGLTEAWGRVPERQNERDYGGSPWAFQTLNRPPRGRSDEGTPDRTRLAQQTRLLTASMLLRFDGGDRRHIQDTPRRDRGGEDMRRPRRADQDRSDRHRIRHHLDHLIGDVGG